MDRGLEVEALLSTYPRTRPALPPAQQAGYVEHYRRNRAGRQGLSRAVAKLEAWMHRRVSNGAACGRFLEIGAGNLNHVPYLPGGCTYDAVEPFRELWDDSPYRSRVRHVYSDLAEIPENGEIPENAGYDCIFSVAVLEHLNDLPFVLARSGLLLREGGTFRAGFPSEGGLLWGLAWRVTTGIEYRLKRGLDYGNIMRHEHLNTAPEILFLLDYFYRQVEISRFPLPFHQFSFYTAALARAPRLDRCLIFNARRTQSGVCSYE
jgi:SAM-dependent methyltransferase